ncbi:hypothetical protein CKQ90_36015, partial [Klebsiella pneumoniae]
RLFKPNGDESQESFCIMIPPPNVTGSLHMGHALRALESRLFKPNGDESQESFCIMIPPPNVTGSLHMGHA